MNPYLLRQLWAIVESSQGNILLKLDDNGLVHWLIEQISGEQSLNQTEAVSLTHYIRSRTTLIRDLADSR